jgi:hypothetical protein
MDASGSSLITEAVSCINPPGRKRGPVAGEIQHVREQIDSLQRVSKKQHRQLVALAAHLDVSSHASLLDPLL